MIIKLHQISDTSTIFEFTLVRSDLVKLEDRIGIGEMTCTAELSRKQDAIMLHGTYSVSIETGCDRCLEPVVMTVGEEFDLVLVNEESYDPPQGDVEITLESEDIDFYRGHDILLSEYFEDQLLLDLPLSIKCSETCQGLCPDCGTNRNHDSCRCTGNEGNNPFAVLGGLEN